MAPTNEKKIPLVLNRFSLSPQDVSRKLKLYKDDPRTAVVARQLANVYVNTERSNQLPYTAIDYGSAFDDAGQGSTLVRQLMG